MSRNQRLAFLGLAAVVVVVAIVIIGSGGSDKNDAGTTTDSATVVVENGKPVGGIAKPVYKKGGRIKLTVQSDAADEVHFHGYDVHKDVAKGGTVTFDMPATIEGRFEVELENHKEQLADVTVEP